MVPRDTVSFVFPRVLMHQPIITMLHSKFHHASVISNMVSFFATVYDSLSFANVLLALLLLLLLHYLMVLYEFRSMPPGPRLTAIPVLGHAFSLDFKADKLTDAFKRSVNSISTQGIIRVQILPIWVLCFCGLVQIVTLKTGFFRQHVKFAPRNISLCPRDCAMNLS